MKKNEIKELSHKSLPELKKMLTERQMELKRGEVEKTSGKTKNINLVSGIKKDIARILTIIKQKETA